MRANQFFALFFSLFLLGFTRTSNSDFTKESHKVFHDNDTDGIESNNVKGKEMSILFNCCFDDSVVVYLNDKVVYGKRLKTDPVLSFSGATQVRFDNNLDSNVLRVELPEAKVCLEILLDRNYKFLYLSRSVESEKRYGYIWSVIYRNIAMEYE